MSKKKHGSGKAMHLCEPEAQAGGSGSIEKDPGEASYTCSKCHRAADDRKALCSPERTAEAR